MESNKFPELLYYYLVIAYITRNFINSEVFKKRFIEALYFSYKISIKSSELLRFISDIKLLDSKFNVNKKISNSTLSFVWNLLNNSNQEFLFWKKELEMLLDNNSKPDLLNLDSKNDYLFNNLENIYELLPNLTTSETTDAPKKVAPLNNHLKAEHNRSVQEAAMAILAAKNKCEIKCDNLLFDKFNSSHKYLEAHHLIPLNAQIYFPFSIDVSANIVALCPSCHREIHYGNNKIKLIRHLYYDRKDRLANCSIDVSLERLINFY